LEGLSYNPGNVKLWESPLDIRNKNCQDVERGLFENEKKVKKISPGRGF
jgi:hypothetical protein